MKKFVRGGRGLSAVSGSSLIVLGLASVFSGCAPELNRTIVTQVDTYSVPAPQGAKHEVDTTVDLADVAVANKRSLGLVTPADVAVVSEVTLVKEEILGQVFLYSSDLQYSAIDDEKYDLTLQSMAMGHVPTQFRIFGNTLQLVADQRTEFESDVNHPERLVHEFPIVKQDDLTLTIAITRASPTLTTVVAGAKAPKERTSWVRSVQYVREGNYLMFESSLETGDGSIMEFMEALFPRRTLVPDKFEGLRVDEDQDLADRFRFLSWGKVFMNFPVEGRVETKMASRFRFDAATSTAPIDWYVTGNIPDAYLSAVKTGVEGWNRYSQKMWSKDMIRLVGKVPAGVKLGDPRYNIINWDNVAEAGAAYESQTEDPTSGLQSHSLIYLPLAWVNIGKDYWKTGQFSDRQERVAERTRELLSERSFLGRKLEVGCVQGADAQVSLRARENPEAFAKELLKGVVFHEIGHALGLAHNFKGSLVYEPESEEETPITTSIMDYNRYDLERAAFDGLESSTGPLFEYDRQILSVLYNGGKEVRNSDPVLPACNDAEADGTAGGIDPLCSRYDTGKDPTSVLKASLSLLSDENAKVGGVRSLPLALKATLSVLGKPEDAKKIEDVQAKVIEIAAATRGLVGYYLGSGAQSVGYMARSQAKILRIFKKGVLDEEYDAAEMRARVAETLEALLGLEKLPDATTAALAAVQAGVKEWIAATEALKSLTPAQREQVVTILTRALANVHRGLDSNEPSSLLVRVRGSVGGALVRQAGTPFEMGKVDGKVVDYEASSLALLEKSVSALNGGKARPAAERLAYITALLSFKDTADGRSAIERVRTKLNGELAEAPDAVAREQLRILTSKLEAVK